MRRLGPATLGSIAIHGLIVVLALVQWPGRPRDLTASTVPVTIVSSTIASAAPAPNPADEAVLDEPASEAEAEPLETDATTSPPSPAEATPAEPTPRPRPAETAPAEKSRPRPETPRPRPSPPRETRSERPGLDLDALARPRQSDQAPAGDSGSGRAARATGPQINALGQQVTEHWILNCDVPGVDQLSIGVRVTISSRGRITEGPSLTERRDDPVWRSAADAMLRAIRAAEPFDVPEGFSTQEIPFRFRADQACRNR